jgi:hypothetical protein
MVRTLRPCLRGDKLLSTLLGYAIISRMGDLWADVVAFIKRAVKTIVRWVRKALVKAGIIKRYPYKEKVSCGEVDISVARGDPNVTDGAIIFDFKPNQPPSCDCTQFGWIQHFTTAGTTAWRYDNNTQTSGTGSKQGARSDPTKSMQPVTPPPGTDPKDWDQNPWYGGNPPTPNPPADFAEHPTPQPKIGDLPDHPNTEFITQLVCATSGEVLFSWRWGPTGGAGAIGKPANLDAEPTDPPC